MPEATSPVNNGTCFVIMGFGKKTDFETGRVLDLDKSYRNMIKPAVEAAGLTCLRADEIVHSGLIDMPMYEQLLKADVVVADLSTSNRNAYYELGVRHALRPYTTVVVSEDGSKSFPFDLNHVAIRTYHHLGEDIGFDEVMRFRTELTNAIKSVIGADSRTDDSPVYAFLQGLQPPGLSVEAKVNTMSIGPGSMEKSDQPMAATHSAMMQQVEAAQSRGDWNTAKAMLTVVQQTMSQARSAMAATTEQDAYVMQRLALATYKAGGPDNRAALEEARLVLQQLSPATSNDTETIGLWGSIHKQLWYLTKEMKYLDEAIRAYERGFNLRKDYYNGINYAFMLNVRASEQQDRNEAIADFVQAQRVRREVSKICEAWLRDNPLPKGATPSSAQAGSAMEPWYWAKATLGEALMGSGDEAGATAVLAQAYEKAPAAWMKEATEAQMAKLKALLDQSPLL